MEKFSKVLSRQQKQMQYARWRICLAERMMSLFGAKEAARMIGYCRISFDVQPEPCEIPIIFKKVKRNRRSLIMATFSLS
jgi:hypothetical protein